MDRKSLLALLFGFTLLLLPSLSLAAMTELTGTINGHECAVNNMHCPADRMDPHLALETSFVLMVEGKSYLITNVSTNILARHALEKVKIKGEVSDKYSSIKASSLMVMKGDKWVEAWSKASEMAEQQKMFTP